MRRVLQAHISLILVFFYLPIGVLIWYSFQPDLYNNAGSQPTLHWYREFFQNSSLLAGLKNSAVVALLSSCISVTLGFVMAYGFYKYQFRLKNSLNGLIKLVIVAPDLSIAIGLTLVFQMLRISFGLVSITIAHVTFGICYATILLTTRLREMPNDLEQAGRDLGASRWQVIRLITIPAILPALFAALLVCFTISWDDFIFSFFSSSPGETTLPVQIFSFIKRGAYPEINAMGVISMLISFSVIFLSLRFQKITNIF